MCALTRQWQCTWLRPISMPSPSPLLSSPLLSRSFLGHHRGRSRRYHRSCSSHCGSRYQGSQIDQRWKCPKQTYHAKWCSCPFCDISSDSRLILILLDQLQEALSVATKTHAVLGQKGGTRWGLRHSRSGPKAWTTGYWVRKKKMWRRMAMTLILIWSCRMEGGAPPAAGKGVWRWELDGDGGMEFG